MLLDLIFRKPGVDPLVPHFVFRRQPPDDFAAPLFRDIFSLRYEVYCHECGYLDPEDYQNRLETDAYDGRSIHVAGHNQDNEIVGTVRLVLAATNATHFTFEEHCPVFDDYRFPPRERCGEVSRLVVRKTYRRRDGDLLQGVSQDFRQNGQLKTIRPQPSPIGRRNRRSNAPQIVLGLYREMYRYSRENNIRWWYAAMEKSLAHSLAKMGFHFVPIGPETDYYGPVTPYVADLDRVAVDLRAANPFLFAWFNDEPITTGLLARTWLTTTLRRFNGAAN